MHSVADFWGGCVELRQHDGHPEFDDCTLFEIMPLWKLYYHLVWSTHDRQPLLTPTRETQLYRYITRKVDSSGCILHAIGGIEDHIHLVVSIPPKLAIAGFVKHIKGGSSHDLNHSHPGTKPKFSWQNEYGVFSLGSKHSIAL